MFTPGEGEYPGGEAIVVLSYRFWQRRFGGDPSVVGTIVRVDGVPTRVIGITPKDFFGLYHGLAVEGYVPLGFISMREKVERQRFTDRSMRYLRVAGRLRPGVTIAAAQAAVDVVSVRLHNTHPQEKGVTARVIPETMARPLPMRFIAWLMPLARASMLGLAGLVLLIACMNVANLLLVRGAVRQREMAMRAALGGSRRLVRLRSGKPAAGARGNGGRPASRTFCDGVFRAQPLHCERYSPKWSSTTTGGLRLCRGDAAATVSDGHRAGAARVAREGHGAAARRRVWIRRAVAALRSAMVVARSPSLVC